MQEYVFFLSKFCTSAVIALKIFWYILSLDYCLTTTMYKCTFVQCTKWYLPNSCNDSGYHFKTKCADFGNAYVYEFEWY